MAPGGDLNVNAERVIISDGAIITADTFSRDFPGGNLSFDVGQLRVLRGDKFLRQQSGPGDAGNISIRASDLVEVSGGIGKIAVELSLKLTGYVLRQEAKRY